MNDKDSKTLLRQNLEAYVVQKYMSLLLPSLLIALAISLITSSTLLFGCIFFKFVISGSMLCRDSNLAVTSRVIASHANPKKPIALSPQTTKPDHPDWVQHQAIALLSTGMRANSYIPNSLQLRSFALSISSHRIGVKRS
jgi:hypothetical protein